MTGQSALLLVAFLLGAASLIVVAYAVEFWRSNVAKPCDVCDQPFKSKDSPNPTVCVDCLNRAVAEWIGEQP